ncbi:MAG: AAA family ATPase [Eubacterium sp.]|nr:AAA family ATPase [Eubacterium sp.]
MYPREQYLKEIILKKYNGRVKIITGLRRSGKSVLLFQLYREWLLTEGVKEDQIIALALDILTQYRDRGDVGVVEYNTKNADGKKIRKQLEVDFVVNQGKLMHFFKLLLIFVLTS